MDTARIAPQRDFTERRSVMSRYYGSKISRSQRQGPSKVATPATAKRLKRSNRLISAKQQPCQAARFFARFLAVVARLRRETS